MADKEEEEEEEEESKRVERGFPYEVLEAVLGFVREAKDRNAVSAVCREWYRVEAATRRHVFVGNCYAVAPEVVTRRFGGVEAVTLKGKPRFADFNLVPPGWGACLRPWLQPLQVAYPGLLSLSLKRLSLSDADLATLARGLPSFRHLVLVCCDGFSTSALALIASSCRHLTELTLNEDEVEDSGVDWLGSFPETMTSLEALRFDCLDGPINFDALEKLVARCPNLRELRVNKYVSIMQLHRLLLKAPQLTHLGTDSFGSRHAAEQGIDPHGSMMQEQLADFHIVLGNCKYLQCLSGFREIVPEYLPAIYPVCSNLTFLNFSYADTGSSDLEGVIRHCPKLQRLWVLDNVEDRGLRAAAETCRDLRDLRVFPLDAREDGQGCVSDEGLIAISEGCPNLESILYFCQRMTNHAVITFSNNCPNIEVFRLCIMERHLPDYVTGDPMDEAFGAIVRNCKKLTRLAVSGLLTDRAFEYIGRYGKSIKTLSLAFSGESDLGMIHVLNGCTNLKKLEIRDSPFGNEALLAGLHRYESMRFLWMSDCRVSLGGCKELAKRLQSVIVEVIGDEDNDIDMSTVNAFFPVEKLYVYRSVAGPRKDKPSFVTIL